MEYDPSILRLYSRYLTAYATVYTLCLGAIGGFAGYILGAVLSTDRAVSSGLIGCALLGLYGLIKSYSNRVEAQRTLCQVEIESHLRKMAAGLPGANQSHPHNGQ